MKKWIALLLSAMLMLSMLAGCGGGEGGKQKVEIHIW